MTEGGATRTKRMGARFFRNPPQPHMCIQDFLRGSVHPCYINVLSWDKIGPATCPFERLPLYGGMKISPPRTEKPEVVVFFVMANPEILKVHGKHSLDPKEQSVLIELLLDFVEAMNEGIVFARQYKILNDRDITGELKEIWMMVQTDRAKVQNGSGSEEVKRPVPQYPQYQDQGPDQQNQQPQQQYQPQQQKPQSHQQQPQQYRQQQHLHQPQQMQHQQQLRNDEQQQQQQLPSQPPQYHPNSSIPSRESVMDNQSSKWYDLAYGRQPQNTINPQNDRVYYSRPGTGQYIVNRIRDRYIYRDPIVPNVAPNSQPLPQQQNYPAPQYQYQPLPRQVGPLYNNPNTHPNTNMGCPTMPSPVLPPVNNPGMNPGPQLHDDPYQRIREIYVYAKLQRMQQPQQPQVELVHAPPDSVYETRYRSRANDSDLQANTPMNMRIYGPSTNSPPKNSTNKRQVNSPTHGNCPAKESSRKSKSPVKVLQRDSTSNKVQLPANILQDVTTEKKHVQVTDLDEDEPREGFINNSELSIKSGDVVELKEVNQASKVNERRKIMVLKRNKSSQAGLHDEILENGVKSEPEGHQVSGIHDRTIDRKSEDKLLSNSIPESKRNGYIDKEQMVVGSKFVKSFANTLKNVLTVNPASSDQPTGSIQAGRMNGQPKNVGKDNEATFQMYTILRKPEASSSKDELTNEIAQMSIKECMDPSEIGAVPS